MNPDEVLGAAERIPGEVLRPEWAVNVPAVVAGLLLVAVAVGVGMFEVVGTVLDWRWAVTGVLVLSGLLVVLAVAVAGLRRTLRGPGSA